MRIMPDKNPALVQNKNTSTGKGEMIMTGILIALLSGALMSIQGVFNTEVTRQSSIWVSAGWVQLTAFATCVVMWLFTGRQPVSGVLQVQPWYMLTGGAMGAFITYTVIKSMGQLGPAKASMLIVVSQMIIAYLIQVFGMFGLEREGFTWRKVLGAVIAIAGIIVFRYES